MSNVHPLGRSSADASTSTPKQASAGGEAETMNVSASAADPEAAVGSTVSRYVVLEEVGRGGMGRVLRAYDPKLQREVALKEVRSAGRSRSGDGPSLDAEATQRLVAEARAMAKLSHPNVVAVYDVEALPTGEVVLVMEYVAGQTLRAWLRARERPWREVVDCFLAAGRGLAAAHEAGLLHRDFKPANVLVAPLAPEGSERAVSGKDATVKVTDFGLAKGSMGRSSGAASSVGDNSSEDLTAAGVVMGTPRYMAPEQHGGETLTASADQYAYCVALWEALCAEPPFTGNQMAKDKREGPPSWPSPSTPRPVADAIVRGLSPKPEDRWPSMEALLHALSWDPARRRNRWLLGLGATGVVSLAGLSWGAWAQAQADRCSGAQQHLAGIWDEVRREATKEAILGIDKSYATAVWERAKQELDAYSQDWAAMHTEACEATAVRGEQSSQMLDLRMGCLQRAADELRATVDTLADADDKVVQNAHKLTSGLRPLSRCADTEALSAEVEPPLPEDAEAVETIRGHLADAKARRRAGRYGRAQEAVVAAKSVVESVEYGPVQAEVALEEGYVLDQIGEYERSEAALSKALDLGSQWRQREVMGEAAWELMFVVGHRQQRMEEGLRYLKLAKGLAEGNPRREATVANNLAAVLLTQGKYEDAEAEHRAALASWRTTVGPDHPDVAMSRNNLAAVLHKQGKYEDAEAEHRAALALREKALGPDHPDVAMSRNNLAAALTSQGKYEEAEAQCRAALELQEKVLGLEHPSVAMSRTNLAGALRMQGKYEEAEAESRAALALKEKTLGPDHPTVATSRNALANVLFSQGKYEAAEAEYRAALAALQKKLSPEHPSVAMFRNNLASVLYNQGKYEETEAEYRAGLVALQKALGPDHPDVAASRNNLADVLLDQRRPAEALPLAEQAWARRQRDDVPSEQRAAAAFVLARALWAVHRTGPERTRARQLAEDALQSYRRAGEAHAQGADEVKGWLDVHPLR